MYKFLQLVRFRPFYFTIIVFPWIFTIFTFSPASMVSLFEIFFAAQSSWLFFTNIFDVTYCADSTFYYHSIPLYFYNFHLLSYLNDFFV